MKKLIVANWKMNPGSLTEAKRLARGLFSSQETEVVLCPPDIWLPALSRARKVTWGAQNMFWEEKGAFTGEISPVMLKNAGAEYVILGHSARRRLLHETDAMVNRKVRAALAAGLKVILCVGEGPEVKRRGSAAVRAFLKNQLRHSLEGLPNFPTSQLILTYEPVWAISTHSIGSGQAAYSTVSQDNADTPETALVMIRFMRSVAAPMLHVSRSMLRVLYGGSVTSENVVRFLSCKEIDGALVGGASLRPADFKQLVALTNTIKK